MPALCICVFFGVSVYLCIFRSSSVPAAARSSFSDGDGSSSLGSSAPEARTENFHVAPSWVVGGNFMDSRRVIDSIDKLFINFLLP